MNWMRKEAVTLKFAAVVRVCVTDTNDVVLQWPNGLLRTWQAGEGSRLSCAQFDEVVAEVTHALALHVRHGDAKATDT